MRLKKEDKIKLAKQLRDKAIDIYEKGIKLKENNRSSRNDIISVEHKKLSILYNTPFHKLKGAPGDYLLTTWCRKMGGKVFYVYWEQFEIVTFKYGEWMNTLIPDIYSK